SANRVLDRTLGWTNVRERAPSNETRGNPPNTTWKSLLAHVGQDLIPDAVRREAVAGHAGVIGAKRLPHVLRKLVAAHLAHVSRHLAEEVLVPGVAVLLSERRRHAGEQQRADDG